MTRLVVGSGTPFIAFASMGSTTIAKTRFFYKYGPLTNRFVKNSPLPIILLKIAWREATKATRGTFSHTAWREVLTAKGTGGRTLLPFSWQGPRVSGGGRWWAAGNSET